MASRTALPLFCVLFNVGCVAPEGGSEPPTESMYFPVGVAVNPSASQLYVVSSDYDLQYTGGVLQALDLARVRALVPRPGESCGALGEQTAADRLNVPTRCGYVDLTAPQDGGAPLLVDVTKIGAFATDVVFRENPGSPDAGRLFVPVRGDATLHYIDVEGGRLECGQDADHGKCSDAYRVGDDPAEENTRDLRLPPEPFGIDVTEDGRAVLVTHQADGHVSLFVNDWNDGPKLEFVAGGMPARVVGVAALPVPKLVTETDAHYDPGFLVGFRDSPELRLLRFFDDRSEPPRPFIQDVASVAITANSIGADSRGIAVDDSARRRCEAECAPLDSACLERCVQDHPLGVYVGNRAPDSLLVGRTRSLDGAVPIDELPQFYDSVPLPIGVSRVIVGKVIDKNGDLQTRVFAICFDQRKIAIYDPKSRMVEKFVETGRGPHALAIDVDSDESADPGWAFGYLAHFSDSWVGVIDLDQRNTNTYGTLVLALGRPTPPRGSK